ncbi:prepilin peptidase [Latilactobacillus sakei]|uniref:prepilin peptidase n=1 Tax=Latilactobacillus sakei TaxID=1599 RepID=UPI0020C75DE5|nr:A24 family peptidase [Latilactobacillus sakei]MCP8856434.1 prepilin peptidase [Latilactobacillus sakei]
MLLYLIIFYSGACCASFLTVCAWRLPIEKSIITPRSHCDCCQQSLAWYDLLPLFSYLYLRGHCRTCHAQIKPTFLFSELIGGLLACFIFSESLSWDLAYLLVILFYISLVDLFYYILYPIPLFASLVPLFYLYWPQNHWLGAIIICSGLLGLNYYLDGLGLGDVELLTILGLWFGLAPLLQILLTSCLCCLFYYALRQFRQANIRKLPIPFIPFISLGFLITGWLN